MKTRRKMGGIAALVLGPSLAATALASTLAACGDDTAAVDASTIDAASDQGRLHLSWNLLDGETPVSCDALGTATIRIEALPDPGVFAEVDALSCAGGEGDTRLIDEARYDVTVELRVGGATLASQEFPDVDLAGGETHDLGAVEFQVSGTGTLTFQLGAAVAALCAGAAGETLGLDSVIIALRDDDGACIDTSFAIGAGATLPAGDYASDCATAFTCIETDQVITAVDVPGGPRELTVTGVVGGAPCYTADQSFTLSGGDQTTDLGVLSFDFDENAPGCGPDAGAADAGPNDGGALIDAGIDAGA